MSAGHQDNVRRSGLTNPYQDPRSLSGSHWCIWFGPPVAYQPLPYLTQARHDALAVLVWSAGPLPIVTNLPIWLETCRGRPLPIITTAVKGLGMTEHIASGIQHQATGWCWLCRVIRVDNVENRTHTQKGSERWRSVSRRKIFFESGRSASIFTPMVVKLVGQ